MSGNMHLEREQWGQALANLAERARSALAVHVSMADQVHLQAGGGGGGAVDPVLCLQPAAVGRGRRRGRRGGERRRRGAPRRERGGRRLRHPPFELEAVLQESRARQAQNLSEIEVLGERVPIKSDKVRIAILASQQKVRDPGHAQGRGQRPHAEVRRALRGVQRRARGRAADLPPWRPRSRPHAPG